MTDYAEAEILTLKETVRRLHGLIDLYEASYIQLHNSDQAEEYPLKAYSHEWAEEFLRWFNAVLNLEMENLPGLEWRGKQKEK